MIFGTTANGGVGNNNQGTVFEIVLGTTSLKTVATLHGSNGANPNADVTFDSSGDLFGTDSGGGLSNGGTVFEIAHGSTSLKTIALLHGSSGDDPLAGVTFDSSRDLFGTTLNGGANNRGVVYEIPRGSTIVTTNADGDASFIMHGLSVVFGQVVSATATDSIGNTSQFSNDVVTGN